MSLTIKDSTILHEVASPDKIPEAFRQAIRDAIGTDPGELVQDARFHRFRTEEDGDRPDSALACYYLLDTGALFGLAGDYRRDQKPILFWQAQLAGDTRTQEELDQQREAILQAHREQEALAHETARARSTAVWESSSTDLGRHPYLVSHGVLEAARAITGQCVRVHSTSGKLIVPMMDADGNIWNRQAINDKGDKRFIYGGRTEGLGLWIPSAPTPEQTWYAAEGFAKALAVWAATARPVLCCFSAGNMFVAIKARQNRVDLSKLIIAADNNEAGRKAVDRVRTVYPVKVIYPAEGAGDWNDILIQHGMGALKAALSGKVEGIEPEPLFRELLPPEPYPVEALGPIIGPAVDTLVRVIKVPEALAAQSGLGAAALCAQPHANVIIDGRVIPLSLFLITVAGSGERKSAADKAAQVPVDGRQRDLVAKFIEDSAVHRAEQQEFERLKKEAAKAKSGKGGDPQKGKDVTAQQPAAMDAMVEPPPPLLPNIKTADPTAEGLFKAFANGQPSMGLFSDEGGLFVGGHALLQESRLRTIAALSKLWDGSPLDRVRGGDGCSILFDRRLSLHLMMQPLVAAELLNDPIFADQGFLSRTLIAWPESTAGTRLYVAEDISKDPAIRKYWERLMELLGSPFPLRENTRNELEPRNIPLSADGKALWIDYHNIIESQLADDQPLSTIRGFAAKAAEQIARIAGVLAVIETPDTAVIDRQHVQSGIDLMDYYLTETLRIKEGGTVPPELKQADQLLKWAQPRQFIYTTQIYKSGPNGIRTKEVATKAINILVKHRWLLPVEGGMELDGAHRRDVWRVVRKG